MLSSVEKWKLFHPPLDWMPRSKSQAHDELSSIRKTLLITRDSNSNSIPPSLFFLINLASWACVCTTMMMRREKSQSHQKILHFLRTLCFSVFQWYIAEIVCLFWCRRQLFFFNSLVFISILRLFRFLFPAPHSDTIPISSQHSVSFCTRFSRLLCHVHNFCVTIGAIHLYKPGGRWQREIKIYKVPPLGRMSKELKWSNFIFQQRETESDTTEIAVNVSSSHTAHNSYSQQSDSWLAWVEAAAVVCTSEKKECEKCYFLALLWRMDRGNARGKSLLCLL